jgi:hypothetical protein
VGGVFSTLPSYYTTRLRQAGVLVTVGRCEVSPALDADAEHTAGEMGVAACRPLGLNVEVRRAVAALSDQRGVHKPSHHAQDTHLHFEGFTF